jgi:D-alanyl-lipoteichoic acid acyltransferase DltB (MBOAT superfamily)
MNWYEIFKTLFGYNPEEPMLFTSGIFLIWYFLFLLIYSILYKNNLYRTLWVILFSFFFYYKSSGAYLVILCFSILLDYYVAQWIYQSNNPSFRKLLLIISISCNLILLGYFKYTNLILSSFYSILGQSFKPLDIFLPIGISFYTFQTISYIVDVYRKEIKPTKNLLDYTFYMSFFPHLVAGPIVRARDFLPQIYQKLEIKNEQIQEGLWMILKGFIKKAIIADYIAQYNDLVFGSVKSYSGFENLMGLYGYALQIYCDFSGYSDMAIGFALIMGYRLLPNFNSPYVSLNITEFWRRWHISLSHWLRDYVYIPQGGNRKGLFWQNVFLLNTMLIGGLWHGADWKFVLWGAIHGIALIFHKLFQQYVKIKVNMFFDVFSWFITFHLVAFLWVYFRANSFDEANDFIYHLFTAFDAAYFIPFLNVRGLFCVLLSIGYTLHFMPNGYKNYFFQSFSKAPFILKAILFIVVIQIMIQIRSETVQPFIYFQF